VLATAPVAALYVDPAITRVLSPLCIAAGIGYLWLTRWRRR
jgi:hypothetical protein